MRILYVIHSLVVGGAETLAVNYLVKLKELGHDVCLVQMTDYHTFLRKRLDDAGIEVICLDAKWKQLLCFRTFVAKWKPDVIHVHSALEKMRFLSFPAKRTAYTIHSSFTRCLENGKNHRKMLYQLSNDGMTVISLTDETKSIVHEALPNANVIKIPNGFHLDAIRKARYDRETFFQDYDNRAELQNAFLVGHVGRMHPVKNHERLLRIFAEVTKMREDAYLLLVGDGNEERRNALQSLASDLHIANRVLFFGQRSDATAIMSMLDVFVLPSFSEAFPLTAIEAQAHGVRCVVSANVPADVCCSKRFMRVALEETDEHWAQMILGENVPENDNETPISYFDIEEVIKRHLEVYEQMLK